MATFATLLLALVAAAQGGVVRPDADPRIPDPRILGGSSASQGQFPWTAHITLDDRAFCTGALVHSKWVLTAGHCVYKVDKFNLVFGNLLPGGEETDLGVQVSTSSDHILHDQYDGSTIENNIALIKLDKEVVITPRVDVVKLPTYSQVGTSFTGMDASVSGWGKTSYAATDYADTLKWVDLPVISNNLCDTSYHSITEGNICASGLNGRSTCIGDSGSPLVLRQSGGYGPLIGILSYDYLNCERDYPAVFTRITRYLDWIEFNSDIIIG